MIETVHYLDVLHSITEILLDKFDISPNTVGLRIEVADMPSKFLQESPDIFQWNTGRMSCNEPRRPRCRYRSYLAYHRLRLHSGKNGLTTTYESSLSCVDEWFCREPFPHEGTSRSIVDRVDQTTDVVVHCARVWGEIDYLWCWDTYLEILNHRLPSLVGAPWHTPSFDCHYILNDQIREETKTAITDCLPRRDMPSVVPCRSEILWYFVFLPVMTALK